MAAESENIHRSSSAILIELQDEVCSISSSTGIHKTGIKKSKSMINEPKRQFENMNVAESVLEQVNGDTGCFRLRPTHPPTSSGSKPKKSSQEKQTKIPCFTCFVTPCPDPNNMSFQYPEFMVCYRDPNGRCENNTLRYYCCPLCLVTIEKDGEESYELRAVKTEFNIHEHANQNRNWHNTYWNPHHQQAAGIHNYMHSMHNMHNFNCPLPPNLNFLHRCTCICPQDVMSYFLNRRNGIGFAPTNMHQPVYCHFNYPQGYAYPNNGPSYTRMV